MREAIESAAPLQGEQGVLDILQDPADTFFSKKCKKQNVPWALRIPLGYRRPMTFSSKNDLKISYQNSSTFLDAVFNHSGPLKSLK